MESKILITSRSFGQINDLPEKILKNAGYKVEYYNENFNEEEFARRVRGCEAIVIGGHKFSEEVLRECKDLKLICKHGAGVDNIPLKAAGELGIHVCNAPGTNADAVADLTFGLILDLSRKISLTQQYVRQGQWRTMIGNDVCHKTLGLVGFGAIAEKVAKRALGFDIKLLACDPYRKEIPEEFKGRVALCDKDRLLAESDIISAHLPLNEETRHILSYREIAKMKRGSFLINTSRGGIVDEQAVADALSSGLLAGAAFDVLEKEPLSEDCPVAGFENVVITSHIGMYSQEAIHAVSMICAENAAAWKKKRPLRFELV